MSSLFFWIIILSVLIPLLMRWYRRSTKGRDQRYFGGPGTPGGPGNPGQAFGGPPNQPRDGFTQQDYFAGGFRQIQPPRQDLPPMIPTWQDAPPAEQLPQQPAASPRDAQPSVEPAPPAVPSGPQGYRARKLAELDAKFSAGELAMEDYMAQRDEIMRG